MRSIYYIFRAVHASAIYHLLVKRLDRYLRERKNSDDNSKQFSTSVTVEVIKKASLTNENDTNKNGKSKRFSFRGRKIDPGSRSQPSMVHEQNGNIDTSFLQHEYKSQVDYHEDSYRKLLKQNNTTVTNEIIKKEKNKENRNTNCCNNTEVIRTKEIKRHKRSSSSADKNTVIDSIRHSLLCNSQEHLVKKPIENKKRKPFSPEEKLVTSREMSFDCLVDEAAHSEINNMVESHRKNIENIENNKLKLRKTLSLESADIDEVILFFCKALHHRSFMFFKFLLGF